MKKIQIKIIQKGFTLIEMMLVVAIIAVIAAIAIPSLAHARQNAIAAASQADLKQIATSLELYNSDSQNYPASGPISSTLPGAKYLNNTPNSPGQNGGAYTYTLAASGNEYTITDPATYDASSLGSLGKSSTPASGVATAPTGKCGASGCTHLGFSNTVGVFGY